MRAFIESCCTLDVCIVIVVRILKLCERDCGVGVRGVAGARVWWSRAKEKTVVAASQFSENRRSRRRRRRRCTTRLLLSAKQKIKMETVINTGEK